MNTNKSSLLKKLGRRLKQARILKRETQEDLGVRIGVSRQVIARMEKGDSSTQFDNWLNASEILGLLQTWDNVLLWPEDPFDKFDRKTKEEQEFNKKRVRKAKS
jgi:DNA-binding XRE family transcriptional regulator